MEAFKSFDALPIDYSKFSVLSKDDISSLTEENTDNSIKNINCSAVNLRNLTKFELLPSLEGLCASRNFIRSIENSFSSLKCLTFLDLRSNEISELESDCLDLPNLKVLDLSNNSLHNLPESISKLVSLQLLNLSANSLTDLSEGICQLNELRYIDCSFNQLNHLPINLGKIGKLSTLKVNNNVLSVLPTTLGGLSELKIIQLSYNQINVLPQSVFKLYGLLELKMAYNLLNFIPHDIEQLQQLIVLDLSFNQLSEMPQSVGNISTLKYLNLRGNTQMKSLPGSSVLMASLTELILDQCNFQDLPESLCYCENLRVLNINGNKIKSLPIDIKSSQTLAALKWSKNELSSIPDFLGAISNLQILDLSCNSLTNLPQTLSFLSCLKQINLSSNRFDIWPDVICSIKTINFIDLSKNELDSLPDAVSKSLPQLQTLNLSDNRFEQFQSFPPSLKHLNLSTNPLTEIADELCVLNELEHLDLSNTQFGGEFPTNLHLFPALRVFRFDQEAGQKVGGVHNCLEKLGNLEEISLANNSLLKIPEQLNSLEKLTSVNLCGNRIRHIDGSFIQQFKETLESLDLSRNNISALPANGFTKFQKLAFLNLKGNPLKFPPSDITDGGNLNQIGCYLKSFKEIDGMVLDQMMEIISEKLPKERTQHLLRKLKVPNNVISELESLYKGKYNQKLLVTKGLEAWRSYLDDKATTDSLIRCFFLIGEKELHKNLKQISLIVNRIKL